MGSLPQETIPPRSLMTLRSQIKASTLLAPDSEAYAQGIKRWSEAAEKTSRKPHSYYPYPVILIRTTNSTRASSSTPPPKKTSPPPVVWASAHRIDLAVMGGGHATGGASSSDGGIVIDLSNRCAR